MRCVMYRPSALRRPRRKGVRLPIPGRLCTKARRVRQLTRGVLVGFLREVDERRLHPPAEVLGVREPELHEDRVDVLLDGALGEEELLGDRLVALALGDLGEDLPARAASGRRAASLRPGARGDERLDHLGVDHGAALRDRPQRGDELGAVRRRSLRRYARPSEPCSSSASAYCGVAYWLTTTTPMPGCVSRSRLATTIPRPRRTAASGCRSARRPGCSASTAARSSSPSSQTATISTSGVAAEEVRERLPYEVGVLGEHDTQRRGDR